MVYYQSMSNQASIFDMDGVLVNNRRYHVLPKTCNLFPLGVKQK